MKTVATEIKEQKNKLNVTEPWVYLFILQVSATEAMYITNGNSEIGYNGHTYKPFPVKFGDIVEDSKGNLQTVTIMVSNINRAVMAYMETSDGLVGKTVQVYLVNKKDTTDAVDMGVYEIIQSNADANVATFTLGHYDFFDMKFPRNRYIRYKCRFIYGSTECGYVANKTVILRPDGAGRYTNWNYQYPATTYHWDKVKEVVADDEATYVGDTYVGNKDDMYELPTSGIPVGSAIVSVKFFARACQIAYPPIPPGDPTPQPDPSHFMFGFYDGVDNYWVTDQIKLLLGGGSWSNYDTGELVVNPRSGVAWTIDEINALQIGISTYNNPAGSMAMVTQVYVVVTYDEYPAVTNTCDKTLDGGEGCREHGNEGRFGGFPGIPYGAKVKT